MKQIKDPVHGYIPVEGDFIRSIIDTKHFQRLRQLKQLSATYLVYPSANHTRFEHSIGVYHLAGKAYKHLSQKDEFCKRVDTDEIERTLLAASLLHDIGHPPFSHIGEKFLETDELRERLVEAGFVDKLEEAGIRVGLGPNDIIEEKSDHALLSCIITLEEYCDELRETIGVDPYEVCSYILGISIKGERGDGWQHKVTADLLSSPMDVDRLDYITRDNFMSGADVANIDTQRMVESYTTCQNSLTLSDKALSTIGNYLEGRISVYMWITQHHKSVYVNALLRELLQELDEEVGGNLFNVEKILDQHINDNFVMEKLRELAGKQPDSRLNNLHERFISRDLMHSCWKHKLAYQHLIDSEIREKFFLDVDSNENVVQENLRDELGIDQDELWVEMSYVPNYQPSELRNIQLAYNDEKMTISEVGLYEEREYPGPTPYIFAPAEYQHEICKLINKSYS